MIVLFRVIQALLPTLTLVKRTQSQSDLRTVVAEVTPLVETKVLSYQFNHVYVLEMIMTQTRIMMDKNNRNRPHLPMDFLSLKLLKRNT